MTMHNTREKAREKGWEAGRKEGHDEGRKEGTVATLRQAIVGVLSARKVRLTAAKRARLETEARLEVLQTWALRTMGRVERAGLSEGPEIAALLRLGGTRAGLKLR